MPLILSVDNLNIIKWWLDASYAVHDDMHGNNWETISLGRGSVLIMSKNKKINTKISTKAELIGADDAITQIFWTK